MTKKQTIMLAVAGVALAAGSQAQAQLASYTSGDLLLNFRNTASPGNDVVVNLGLVSTFQNLTGTTVLDPSSGGSYGFTQGELSSFYGAGLSTAAFSAVADSGTTIWDSRQQTGPGLLGQSGTTDGNLPGQNTAAGGQTAAINHINGIGTDAVALTGTTAVHLDPSGLIVSESGVNDYENLALNGGSINYAGISTAHGGPVESALGSLSYSGLWEQPQKNSGSDQYLGFFTFNDSTGEVDFTSVNSAVPEIPGTGMIAGLGMLVAAVRRQFMSRKA